MYQAYEFQSKCDSDSFAARQVLLYVPPKCVHPKFAPNVL